jgi:hypothetical protein
MKKTRFATSCEHLSQLEQTFDDIFFLFRIWDPKSDILRQNEDIVEFFRLFFKFSFLERQLFGIFKDRAGGRRARAGPFVVIFLYVDLYV